MANTNLKDDRENNVKQVMKEKGMSVSLLSSLTEIPETTLYRIINQKTKNIKPFQMDRLAFALRVPIKLLFPFASSSGHLASDILPEEAGNVITKTLTEDESLLLYFYQLSSTNGKKHILEKARVEAWSEQQKIFQKAKKIESAIPKEKNFTQLSLNFSES